MNEIKRALIVAHVASMIDLFNRRNISILQELGYEVHIACNFQEGNVTSKERVNSFYQDMIESNVICHNVQFPRKVMAVSQIVSAFKNITQLLRDNNYQVIHCQAPISGVITRLAARKFNKNDTKVIYVAHGFHFFKGGPIRNWILYYPVEYLCSKFTDCLVTINLEDYRCAKKNFHKIKNEIEYIPGVGIDTDKTRSDFCSRERILEEFNIPSNSKVVVTVGELTPGKNHITALKAFAKANIPNSYYIICGIGKYEAILKELVNELNIKEKVVFAGYRSDILDIDQASNVFLFPSLREGLPVAVMEAMSIGLPVICSDVRGNRDLIVDGKGGYIIDKYDVDGFANALREILFSEYDMIEMGEFNKRIIVNYDKRVVDSRMKSIYEN